MVKMNFERGIDPKQAIGIGREANPKLIRGIEETFPRPEDSYRMDIVHGRKLLINICGSSKTEALFNLQDRSIMLVFFNGDRTNITQMGGEWVSYGGLKLKIPEFLKPEGASRL